MKRFTSPLTTILRVLLAFIPLEDRLCGIETEIGVWVLLDTYFVHLSDIRGYVVALRYKPVGRGFDSRLGHRNFVTT